MKLLLFLASLIWLTCQLNIRTDSSKSHKTKTHRHRSPYFGGHYRNHKTKEYVDSVVQKNKEKIARFNKQNKQALQTVKAVRSVRSVGSGKVSTKPPVEEVHTFVMGETKFIQFTQEQFQHLFTGLIQQRPTKSKLQSGLRLKKLQKIQGNEKKKQSQLHMMDRLLLQQVNSEISHRFDWGWSNNNWGWGNNDWSWDNSISGWWDDLWNSDDIYDPYQAEQNYNDLYGDTNSEDNWGWSWSTMDDNYYNTYDTYEKWQEEHWGRDWSKWDDQSWNIDWWDIDKDNQNKNNDQWYNNWEEEQEENQNNNEWWEDDHFEEENSASKKLEPYPSSAVEVNWAKKGGTTHVKQQGICGSCWAYTAVALVESKYLIEGKPIMDLSEQQLVDCQTIAYGCQGGWIDVALDFVKDKGLVAEEKYPYRGLNQDCKHAEGPHSISSYYEIKGSSAFQNALRKGPIGAAVYVDDGFQFYERGIFDACQNQQVNHAIVVVGFTSDYWIIRNSWGADWGEEGHIRIKRNQNGGNACRIQNYAYALL